LRIHSWAECLSLRKAGGQGVVIAMSVGRFGFSERRSYVRYFGAGAVVCTHILVVWMLTNYAVPTTARVGPPGDTIVITLLTSTETASVPSEHVSAVRRKVLPKRAPDVASSVNTPVMAELASADIGSSATVVAPRILEDALPDSAPFATMAGLSPGQTSLVVLRVEILVDGSVGRIRIDVSSGNERVDEAAMKYAHLTRWLPGGVGGIKEKVWARFGVQLMA
jgi:TonB family protein